MHAFLMHYITQAFLTPSHVEIVVCTVHALKNFDRFIRLCGILSRLVSLLGGF